MPLAVHCQTVCLALCALRAPGALDWRPCFCRPQAEHLRSELRERNDSMSALQVGHKSRSLP